jgi:hypothetical protein
LCRDFGTNEKFYDYLQILSNNYIYDPAYVETLLSNQDEQYLSQKHMSHYENPNLVTIDNFMKKLFERLTYLPGLFSQVENFLKYKKYKKFLPDALAKLKDENRYQLVKKKTEISDFIKITHKEYLDALCDDTGNGAEGFIISSVVEHDEEGNRFKRYIKIPVTKYNEEDAQYYLAIFERKNYKFKAFIEIGYDYPER